MTSMRAVLSHGEENEVQGWSVDGEEEGRLEISSDPHTKARKWHQWVQIPWPSELFAGHVHGSTVLEGGCDEEGCEELSSDSEEG